MNRPTLKRLLPVLLVMGLALAWLLSQRYSNQGQIRRTLAGLESTLSAGSDESSAERKARARAGLAQALSDDVVVQLPGRHIAGKEAVLAAAETAVTGNARIVTIEALEVEVFEHTARASGEVSFSDSQRSDLHRDRRHVSVELGLRGDSWLVTRIQLGAKTHEEPEARP